MSDRTLAWLIAVPTFLALQLLVFSMIKGWFPVHLMVVLRRSIPLFAGRSQIDVAKEQRRFRMLGFIFFVLEGCAIVWAFLMAVFGGHH